MDILFVPLQYVKENTQIDNNISDKVLTNIITTAQDVYLQEILGSSLFSELSNSIRNNTFSTIQRKLIDEKILKYLLAVIESLSIDELLIKISESGIYSATPANTQQKSKDELKSIKISKEKKISTYESLIKSFLEENIDKFPNYNSIVDIPAKKVQNYGFFFDNDDDYYYNNKRGSSPYDESL